MIRGGLVSITFRKLHSREVVDLMTRTNLIGIEWGGDVHVPHGEIALARDVARMTRDAGLLVAAYGSYYRVGVSEADGLAFERVLESAMALGAPTVRVWAGNRGSADADASYRALTDTNVSARRLLEEVGHPNVRTYWQPPVAMSPAECLAGLAAVSGYLSNAHVFQWEAAALTDAADRRPLAEGVAVWRQYLERIAATDRDHFAMIEFVREDAPEQFLADARVLSAWLAELDDR
ncbi:MAG: sugar phosphate isomerase/epimerase [Anaerolineae bacterium]|nr:sugar phosphate isomerase/epimerase [Anaerolineae bacterium]